MERCVAATSHGLPFHYGKHRLSRALAGIAIAIGRMQTSPHLAKASHHVSRASPSGMIRRNSAQTRCGVKSALHQLRHDIPFGDQVDHREAVHLN